MSVNSGEASSFTVDDIWRLERSVAWQQRPELIEAFCRLLHDIDPMNIWSGENPHAMTEYLTEAVALASRLSGIQSEQDVASILAAVFDEKFDGHPANCDWEEVAKAALPILTKLQGARGQPLT